MNGMVEDISEGIKYIEDHLTEEIDMAEVAKHAYVSSFYFQKIFHVLCGFTVSEYIRNRRLTLAAQELSSTDALVIDVALKYGYDSPDSFSRAFTKFHGVTPKAARGKGMVLNSVAPLKIKISLEGGTMLEYKVVKKEQFTVMGRGRIFNTDTSYQEIPKFWQEHMESEDKEIVRGMFGICLDSDGKNFEYLIADNYRPWKEVPEGYVTRVIPAGTWVVFPCRGPLPKALQDVNSKIWSEWVPSCKAYRLSGNYNIEMYTPRHDDQKEEYSEIWIPVEEVK